MERTRQRQSSNSRRLKDELELYHFVSTIYYWDVFVYIFICLWDKERPSLDHDNRELGFRLKSAMNKLYQYRGAPDGAVNRTEKLLDDFMRSRSREQDCGHYIRLAHSRIAYKQINFPRDFESTIVNMSSDHRGALMEVCVQQLRSRASTAKLVYTTMTESADANEDLDTLEADNLDSLKYQASLSSLTNFRWTDDDDNNAVHLTEDINNFRLFLEDFTRVKGRGITFHEQEAIKLLEEYKCEEGETLKSTLASVLSRRVLELVLDSIDEYFRQTKFDAAKIDVDMTTSDTDIDVGSSDNTADTLTNSNLEAEIVGITNQLTGMLDRFVDIRDGNDALSEVVSSQIRQRVHAILGFRGFSNENHEVITSITAKVINMMNEYRTITDETKLERSEKDAVRVVRDIISIFRFRLQAQEPVPAVNFINAGEKFDDGLIESSVDEKKCRNARVELCWFPVISTDINDKKRKVYSKARALLKYSEVEEKEEEEEDSRSEGSESSEESADTDGAVDSSKPDKKTGAGIDNTVDDMVDDTVADDVSKHSNDFSEDESNKEVIVDNTIVNNEYQVEQV